MDASSRELNAEQWERLKAVVADALEKDDLAERRAFVARACQDDPSVLREAEAMLAFSPQRLERQAETIATVLRGAEPNRTDERIGSYRILRELGRGGMGAVYLAERADDEFNKQVAIKLLKRGTDTDEVLRRFRSEREILARLEQPNIARLIDGGTTEDGLPYFVMEYVIGEPVTEFCRSRELSIEERLRLFLKICGAVQFAHQNLVVHRDLKPGNILVTTEGEPKLLDFGIAKLLAAEDGIMSLTIADHQRLTPAYASPEQVRGEPVTTASDVYALGALLYELLTGTSAHTFATAPPSPTELLRVVGDVAPVRPSAAATDPAIRRNLRGDLDNILLQALRKEPERRYATVDGMANDIRRYQGNFPVRARKDTVGYRTAKFVRRNRLAAAAASIVLLALLVGLGVAAWQAQVAAAQAEVARMERTKAERRFAQVRELARSVMFDYYDAIVPLAGSTAVRERIVRDALKYLDSLSQEASGDASLLAELAAAYWKVASLQGGNATEQLRPTLVSAANLGDSAGAVVSMGKAIAIFERLVRENPAEPAYDRDLTLAYNGLGGLYLASGPPEKAVDYIGKSVVRLEALLAKDPANEDLRQYLAYAYLGLGKALGSPGSPNVGDTKGALEAVRKAIVEQEKLVAEDPTNLSHLQGMGSCHNAMGLLFSALGDKQAELEQNRKGIEIQKRLLDAEPGNSNTRRELAVALGNTGSNLRNLNQKSAALSYFHEALAHYDTLVTVDPKDVFIRRQWAVAIRNVAVTIGADDAAGAFRLFQKAIAILAEIVAIDPNNTDFRRQWAFTYMATGRFQTEIGEFEQAVSALAEGIRIEEALMRDSPADVSVQTTMALLYNQLGVTHAKWAAQPDLPRASVNIHWTHARDAYGRSLAVYQTLKETGKLSAADAAKPNEIAAEIAKCDAAVQEQR